MLKYFSLFHFPETKVFIKGTHFERFYPHSNVSSTERSVIKLCTVDFLDVA